VSGRLDRSELTLSLHRGWNVLLGDNGCGKSTLLKAIGLGLVGDDDRAGPAAERLLRAHTTSGAIELRLGEDAYRTDLVREDGYVRVVSDQSTPVQSGLLLSLGFPPLRGVSRQNPREPTSTVTPNPAVDEHDHRVDHPGYYWLAYEWSNLLPSCSRCNRLTKTNDGRRVGKGERFPVMGQRAIAPGEEANEQPLFLHPCIDDPEQHFGLEPETGVLFGKTPRGRACVELLDLNREGMLEERKRTYYQVRSQLLMVFSSLMARNLQEVNRQLEYLADYRRGKAPFSCAGRKAIRDEEPQLRALFERFSKEVFN